MSYSCTGVEVTDTVIEDVTVGLVDKVAVIVAEPVVRQLITPPELTVHIRGWLVVHKTVPVDITPFLYIFAVRVDVNPTLCEILSWSIKTVYKFVYASAIPFATSSVSGFRKFDSILISRIDGDAGSNVSLLL
jgi:hypothetical protein